MKNLTALVVSVLMTIVAVRYSYLTAIGEIKPILATWMLIAFSTSIGIWTYLKSESEEVSAVTNIANTVDVFMAWAILISIVFFGKEIRYEFTFFEIFCIIVSFLILLFWKIKKKAGMANVMINILLIISYSPTIIWLWNAKVNTESLSVWIMVWIAQLFSLYNPIKEKDWLAILYASRAVVLVGIVLILVIRLELL